MTCGHLVFKLIIFIQLFRNVNASISVFPKDFVDLVIHRLQELNSNEGRRVRTIILMHILATTSNSEDRSMNCPLTLSNVLTDHMKCPLTVQKASPYFKVFEMLSQSQHREDLFESLINENCDILSGSEEENCKFYLSSHFHRSELAQTIYKMIEDCYSEENEYENSSLTFK